MIIFKYSWNSFNRKDRKDFPQRSQRKSEWI